MRRAHTLADRGNAQSSEPLTSLPLDVVTLGIVRDRLRKARQELQQAYLHVHGHPEASRIVAAAGRPLRGALDAFEAAYTRGRL